ncbi:MAG: hypothetical protein ABI550_08735 [Ignavibacteriaceae bacterium]
MKIKILVLFIAFFFPTFISAQNGSTYSRYGIGDLVYSYSARRLGMGQIGTSISDEDFIGTVNPASLNRLNYTRIEFGGYYNGMFLSNNQSKKYYSETEFSGFTFGFPISQLYGIGAAIGIIPYSNVSYKVSENISGSAAVGNKIDYEGSGGLSKIFIGASYKLPIDFSIGATLDYYFGNLNYESTVSFANSETNKTEYLRSYRPNGVGTTVGFISPDLSNLFNSESISDFRFGVSANILSNLSADTILTATTPIIIDTLGKSTVDIKIPTRLSAGFSFKLNQKYLISLDYVFQPFKNYSLNGIKSPNLRDVMKFSTGFEYRPLKDAGASFWEQIIWRSGLSYEQTQYEINNTGINQYSVSGGFSLPLGLENTLDIALVYSMRGSTASNLFKENILKLGLGISFGDLWFIRQEK